MLTPVEVQFIQCIAFQHFVWGHGGCVRLHGLVRLSLKGIARGLHGHDHIANCPASQRIPAREIVASSGGAKRVERDLQVTPCVSHRRENRGQLARWIGTCGEGPQQPFDQWYMKHAK